MAPESTSVFDSAVEAARAELEAASEGDTPEAEASEGLNLESEVETEAQADPDQAEADTEGQAESELELPEENVSEDDESLFADLELPDGELEEETSPQSFVLPGVDEPVSLEELKDGYLRQADYTRKTQELATQRKDVEKAVKIHEALVNSPHEFARQIAEAAGLIEKGATAVNVVELPFRSEEDIQAEIDRKVEEALANHPALLEAQQMTALQEIEQEFVRVEEVLGQKLSAKDREVVLKVAYEKQTGDLEMVTRALLSRKQDQVRKREALKQSAPARPTGKASSQSVEVVPQSFEEAALLAADKLGIKLNA